MNIILVGICIWFFLVLCVNENKNTELEQENKKLKEYQAALKYSIELYKDHINLLESKLNFSKINIDEDLKRAVKFAMIQAHPDKGNTKNTDDFIKFKELYDKLK